MQILGIRTAPSCVRYVILEWDGHAGRLINASSEHKLNFPADKTTTEAKIHWLREEFIRILRQNPQIVRIALKTKEYGPRPESAASREAAYYDAAVLIVAGEKALPVNMFLYSNMGTKRAEVEDFAEASVSRIEPYWNEQIADAIAAAWSARNL